MSFTTTRRITALNHLIQVPCNTFKIVYLPGQQTFNEERNVLYNQSEKNINLIIFG